MFRLAAITVLTGSLFAADWEEYRTGPFEVWTEASEKEGRQLLVRLEQTRHMLGTYLGKQDLASLWTIRVVIRKNQPALPWKLGRDAMVSTLMANTPPSREWLREAVKLLLESNAKRMPSDWERGLIDFLSTLDAAGPKITLGTPPKDASRNLDWARVHYLATNPEYGSRFRVLLNNLQQGAEEDVAFRNSIGMTRAQLDAEAAKHLANAALGPATTSGRPITDRDFPARPVEVPRALAAIADVTGNVKLVPAGSLEAAELAGLDAARNGRKAEARDWLKQAIANGSTSALVCFEYGRLLDEPDAKRNAFVDAAKKNGRWAAPYIEMARLETTPARIAHYLKEATLRDPRNSDLWQSYAKALSDAEELSEASKAWFNAELTAPTVAQRDTIREARRRFIEERAAREEELKRLQAEERQREMDRLRNEAINRIREAEAKANKGGVTRDPNQKVEEWWDDKQPSQKLNGILEKVDCLGRGVARLFIRPTDGKPIALLIPDPGKVVLLGGSSEAAFSCGVQKPARPVTAEYKVRADAKLATAGDIAILEFR